MVLTRSNPRTNTERVGEQVRKRPKVVRLNNDSDKRHEMNTPRENDENEELDSPQKNDGKMGKTVTIESMQSMSECTMKLPSELGSRNTEHSAHNDREKIAKRRKHIERCVKTQLILCIKRTWYANRKFVTDPKDELRIMSHACHDEPSMIPVTGYKSKGEFVRDYIPLVKKCMSQLRRNSQILARQHCMGECDVCL